MMNLGKLIEAANRNYPDGFLTEYFDLRRGRVNRRKSGDSLARFIVVEIAETFDMRRSDPEQLDEAVRVLERAQGDLGAAIRGLNALKTRLQAGKGE